MTRLFIIIFLLIPLSAFSAITFDVNGKWDTTFDCVDWESRMPSSSYLLSCDGLARSGDAAPLSGGEVTTLSSVSNYTSGAGGKGMRFWKDSGADFLQSGTVAVSFPSPQREIWVRWYARWEEGFAWNTGMRGEKSLYFKSTNSNPYTGFFGSGWRIYHANLEGGNGVTITIGGWTTLFPTGSSNGTWHSYEVHIKADTDGTDGAFKVWIDGDLLESHTGLDYGAGGASFNGWTYFDFLSNQANPGLERAYYVDVDDMVIYNQTPPSVDASGNAFIGPIDWDGGATHVNGVCGSNHLATLASLTSGNAANCSVGSVSGFTGSGPWSWSCLGTDGGSNASCSASLLVIGGGSGRAVYNPAARARYSPTNFARYAE